MGMKVLYIDRKVKSMENIVLVGMPGAGKSTVGVILAKVLGMNFIDSDLLIQDQEGSLLKDIIKKQGLQGYIKIENQVNRDISVENTVIATGGSVVYCPEAMEHFRETSKVVYIKLSFNTINKGLVTSSNEVLCFETSRLYTRAIQGRLPYMKKVHS